MKTALLFAIALGSPTAFAQLMSPAQRAAERLDRSLEFGINRGVTANGKSCQVTHGSIPAPNPNLIEYSHTEIVVFAKDTQVDKVLGVEFFYDGDENLKVVIDNGWLSIKSLDSDASLNVFELRTQKVIELSSGGRRLECRLPR